MNSKPKPWIAAVLNLILGPSGFLYAGKPKWALAYLAILFPIAFLGAFTRLDSQLTLIFQLVLIAAAGVLAFRAAKANPEGSRSWYSRWYGIVLIFLGFASFAFMIRAFLYEPYKVPSTSMEPTFPRGTMFLAEKIGFGHYGAYGMRLLSVPMSAQLKRGDVIVFDYPVDPSQAYLKRVVGLPGDLVEYRGKHLFINGRDTRIGQVTDDVAPESARLLQRGREKLDGTEFDTLIDPEVTRTVQVEPMNFAFRDHCTYPGHDLLCKVPPGNYFVLGDYRDNSADSRYWGFVRADQVIGKAIRFSR